MRRNDKKRDAMTMENDAERDGEKEEYGGTFRKIGEWSMSENFHLQQSKANDRIYR
jgi:hypothetical protein